MNCCKKARIWALVKTLALAWPLAASAQTTTSGKPAAAPIKFGQPEPADFEAKNFVADSGAAAVVLCDYGVAQFSSPGGRLGMTTVRTTRIKILKKAGYDYATVEVPLYHRENQAERLSNLKGITYLRGADGKITQTKLDASNIFEEKRTSNWTVQKFTLPNVQEGAVIEYSYLVTSTFLDNYQDWTFQRDIPTRWSEYRTSIPQVYHYRTLYRGYAALDVNEASVGNVNLVLTNHLDSGAGAGAGMDVGSMGVSMTTEQHRWVIKDLPAFRAETYSTTPNDYLPRMTFELVGVQWPNQKYQDLTDSWPKKNKVLLGYENFGQALRDGKFLRATMQPLVAQYPDPAARAAAVRQLVLQTVKYDGTNRYSASGPLKRSYDLHRGTAADVNLLLIAALREAGLPTEPVLLSTRNHGAVSKEYTLLEQFNYVVALVALPDQKELLLDATEPLLPVGVLPPRCLNQVGRLVPSQEGEGRWVSLVPSQRYTHYQEVNLALDAQGNLSGKVREEHGGYAGLEVREKLQQLGEKKYVTTLAAAHPGWEIPSYAFSKQAEVSQSLSLNYELRQPGTAGAATELYINPMAYFGEARNPFQHEHRSYPVDIGMMQQDIVRLTLTLPAGYVAELPKPVTIILPENGGRYMYAATSPAPGTVQFVSRLTLDKPIYGALEYQALREFYRQVLAKQAEALVIKKTGS